MKKIPMICNIISILSVIAFIIKCIADYKQYTGAFNSAPFSLWIGVNALILIVPAIIVFIAGIIINRKNSK